VWDVFPWGMLMVVPIAASLWSALSRNACVGRSLAIGGAVAGSTNEAASSAAVASVNGAATGHPPGSRGAGVAPGGLTMFAVTARAGPGPAPRGWCG